MLHFHQQNPDKYGPVPPGFLPDHPLPNDKTIPAGSRYLPPPDTRSGHVRFKDGTASKVFHITGDLPLAEFFIIRLLASFLNTFCQAVLAGTTLTQIFLHRRLHFHTTGCPVRRRRCRPLADSSVHMHNISPSYKPASFHSDLPHRPRPARH